MFAIDSERMALPQILTIGYEGSTIDDFVSVLASLRVSVLCDVRDVVASRKPGFSKNPLTEALRSAGIEYRHFKGLGDPKEGRLAARAGDFAKFRQIYGERLASDGAQLELVELEKIVANSTACLMCFEREPSECHRSIVADALRTSLGCTVRHVGVPKGFAERSSVGRPPEEKSRDYNRQGGA